MSVVRDPSPRALRRLREESARQDAANRQEQAETFASDSAGDAKSEDDRTDKSPRCPDSVDSTEDSSDRHPNTRRSLPPEGRE